MVKQIIFVKVHYIKFNWNRIIRSHVDFCVRQKVITLTSQQLRTSSRYFFHHDTPLLT